MNRQSNRIDQVAKKQKKLYEQLQLRKQKNSKIQSIKHTSIVRFEDDADEQNKFLDTSESFSTSTQQSTISIKKRSIHHFYNVYAGMTDEEWIKVRNAFIAEYLEQ